MLGICQILAARYEQMFMTNLGAAVLLLPATWICSREHICSNFSGISMVGGGSYQRYGLQ